VKKYKQPYNMHPKTASEMLEAWDADGLVQTIEMGGLGPGYEQAIHVLVFEMIRDHKNETKEDINRDWKHWGDDTVRRTDERCGGYSGAQVSVAKSLASSYILRGPEKCFKEVDPDRIILVSKNFP
jgi:hypothetical protein